MILYAFLAALLYAVHGAANKYVFATRIGQVPAALLVISTAGLLAAPFALMCDTHWVPEAGSYIIVILVMSPPAFMLATYSYSREDASVVGPIIGMKILFLPFMESLLFGKPLSGGVWAGAAFSAVGIAFVSQTDVWTLKPGKLLRAGVLMMLSAAMVFALGDLLCGEAVVHWPNSWAFTVHLNALFGAVGFTYFGVICLVRGRRGMKKGMFRLDAGVLRDAAVPLLIAAAGILGAQFLLFHSFAMGGQITLSNIVYNTRGLLIVGLMSLLVLARLSRVEKAGWKAYVYRSIGAALLVVSIAVALR